MTPADEILRELLRDEPFLRRLAVRLVGDAAAADDLVQETWLEALRRPPRHGARLRSWATTVLRRRAAKRRRAEARRTDRERGAARAEHIANPLEAVERRLDAQRLVVDQLRALPQAQREALVLRYAEDLGPSTIAARQGVSVETVKARLRRGLATLRQDLDRRHGNDRARWVLLLAPLTREPVAPALPSAALSFGGLLAVSQTLKVVLAGAVVLAAGLVFRAWSAGAVDPPEALARSVDPGDVRDGSAPDSGPSPRTERAVALDDLGGESHAAPPAVPDATAGRELVVHLAGEASGAAEVRVEVLFLDDGRAPEVRLVAPGDVPGTLRLGLDEVLRESRRGAVPAGLRVSVEHPVLLPASVTVALGEDPALPYEVILELAPAAVLFGSVTGAPPDGRAHVAVFGMEEGRPREAPIAVAPVAPDGTFTARLDHRGEVACAALCGSLRPGTGRALVRPGLRSDAGVLVLEVGAAIAGTVRGAAAGTEVRVQAELRGALVPTYSVPGSAAERLLWTDGRFEVGRASVRADAEGAFEVRGLAAARHALSVDRPAGAAATWGSPPSSVSVVAPATGVVLDSPWALLEISLALPDDLEGAGQLLVGRPDWTPKGTGLHASRLLEDPVVRVGLSPGIETEARVEFHGYDPVVVRARAERAGEVLRRSAALLRPVGTARLRLEVTGAQLSDGALFMLLDEDAPRDVDPSARLYPRGPASVAALDGGALVFDAVAGGARRLRLVPGGSANERHGALLDELLELELPRGGEHAATVALRRGATLRVQVLGPSGEPVDAEAGLHDAAGERVPALFTARDARGNSTTSTTGVSDLGWNEVVPNLEPGAYELRVRVAGRTPRSRAFRVGTEPLDLRVDLGRR